MKIMNWLNSRHLVLFLLILFSCKKENTPILTTSDVTAVSQISATSGGSITSDGGETIINRGVCWSTNQTPTISDFRTIDGAGAGSFTSNIFLLNPSTNYFVRAYATNSTGTGYGMTMSFKTLETTLPVLSTSAISESLQTTSKSGGIVSSDGGAAITARGVCWGIIENPTISDSKTVDGNGTGSFTSNMINLSPNTKYFVRAYATNSAGTNYGNQVTFTTLKVGQIGQIFDIENNVYSTIAIGTQIWLGENLKTTKYNDGTTIANVTGTSWGGLTTPAYCWYNNDVITNKNTYGALYNWYAVNTGKLCPTGWHVPSNSEWIQLIDYLGGETIAGGKLKETGTMHWLSPNTGATNATGYDALPGGYCYYGTGTFADLGSYGNWWSSTTYSTTDSWCFYINSSEAKAFRYYAKIQGGYSIRCLKD